MKEEYFIIGSFDDEPRIVYSNRKLEEIKSVLRAINKYQALKENEREAGKIKEWLNDTHSVNIDGLETAIWI